MRVAIGFSLIFWSLVLAAAWGFFGWDWGWLALFYGGSSLGGVLFWRGLRR